VRLRRDDRHGHDALLERWEELARRGESVNLTEEMSELTLEIVLRAIFGRDLERLSAESAAILSRS
ncbi:hypothetical protein B1B_05020, partial [mine drainage metagenome]